MNTQAAQTARARSRGYNMLSAFVARGLTAEMMPSLQKVAALAPALPQPYDAEHAAAAHYQVFGRTVFANQSVFLDGAAQRGGDEVERVRVAYGHCGFAPPVSLEVDGLACEFAALAHLCAAEADAWEDGLAPAAGKARTLQARFLADHLLRWLPGLCEVLQRRPLPLYAKAGVLFGGYVADHAAELASHLAPPGNVALSPAPDPAAADTRLGEIATWLLAPACAGFLLTHDDLHAAAGAGNLPTGFADRRTTLMDLLRAAGAYDALPAVLNVLDARTAQAGAAYAVMADENPALGPWVRPWMDRTANTHSLLAAMRNTQRQVTSWA